MRALVQWAWSLQQEKTQRGENVRMAAEMGEASQPGSPGILGARGGQERQEGPPGAFGGGSPADALL